MAGYRSLARNRDFTVLWCGDTASELGTQLTQFAFPLVTYAVSGSALAAAWVSGLHMVGLVAALLPAGVIVDRVDKRMLMRTTSLVGAVAFASLTIAGILGTITVPHLGIVALLAGLASGLYEPAQIAALRRVVDDDELPVALSQNQARSHVASLLGGPLGGVLYSVTRWMPFAVDAVTYAVVWFTTGQIRTSLAPATTTHPRNVGDWWSDLKAGLGFVASQTFFRVLLFWAACANLLTNALLFVVTMRMISNGESPVAIGMVSLCAGVGGILGSLIAPSLIRRTRTGHLAVAVSWWCVAPLIPLIWWGQPWVVGLCLFLVLLLNPAGNAGISSYRIAITPEELQGRVSSSSRFLVMALMPLAPLAGGVLLEVEGPEAAVATLVAGTLCLAVLLTCSRSIRSVPRPDQWRVPSQV